MAPNRKKLLLIGRSGSGKSSMRSIIFSNYTAFDTHRLGATIDVEHSQLRFLGNVTLNLWDCGGQNSFIENYLTTQRDHIFKMVEVLIFVFDIGSKEVPKDMETFKRCLDNLQEFSPGAKVFVLLHKMDLVRLDRREQVFNATMKTLHAHAEEYHFKLTGFATSIWDESLYKAWSAIVGSLMSNMGSLQAELENFAQTTQTQEIMLFEKITFLLVAHAEAGAIGTIEDPAITQGTPGTTQAITQANGTQANGSALAITQVNGSAQAISKTNGSGGTVQANTPTTFVADPKRFEKISNIIKSYRQSVSKLRTQLHSVTISSGDCVAILEPLTANTIAMAVMPKNGVNANMVSANIRLARPKFEELEKQANEKRQLAQ